VVKEGDGVLDLQAVSMTGVSSVLEVKAGELKLGSLAGTADVDLTGGKLTVEGAAADIMAGGRVAFTVYAGTANSVIGAIDDGVDGNDANGIVDGDSNNGVFDLTPSALPGPVSGMGMWTEEVWLEGDFGSNYTAMWSGLFTAPATGTYEFWQQTDDWGYIMIDLNQNFDFEESNGEDILRNIPGEEGWNTAHTETVDLVMGETYAFVALFDEDGGGDFMRMTMKVPGGAAERINPGLRPERWSAFGPGHLGIDMSGVAITLSESSTVNAVTDEGAVFGSMTFAAAGKTLTTSGASGGILFNQTTFNHPDASITPNANTRFGTLAGDTGTTLTVAGGTRAVIFDGQSSPMGQLTLELVDARLALTDGTLAVGVTFDRPIGATGDTTITAGRFPGGQDGPQVVTLGGTHGVTLNSGVLTLATKDDYTLKLGSALVDNGGDLSLAPGANVDFQMGGGARNVIINGSLGSVVGIENLTLSGGVLLRPTSTSPMDYPLDVGSLDLTIGDNDVVDGDVTLSGVTSASTGRLKIIRSVVNISAPADLPYTNLEIGQDTRDELAVLQTKGLFERSMGSGPDGHWMQLVNNGGFAAKGGKLTIVLNEFRNTLLRRPPDFPVPWGASSGGIGGGLGGFALQFGSLTADSEVDLATNLELGSDAGAQSFNLQVVDNIDVKTDKLVISGNITGTNNDANDMLRINESTGGAFFPQLNGNWRTTKNPLIELTGTNTFTHELFIDQGTVFAVEGVGLPVGAQIHFDSNNWESETVVMSNGLIERNIGDGGGEVKWDHSGGGFAARDGDLEVRLEGDDPNGTRVQLLWNDAGMGFNGDKRLMFGSRYADSVVTFTNPIDGQNTDRNIVIFDNPDSPDDRVVLLGDLTNFQDLNFDHRGETFGRFAARVDIGTALNPVTISTNRHLRVRDGVVFNYYQDLTGGTDFDVTGGSRAIIHGNVDRGGLVRIQHGGYMEIHGNVSWGNFLESRSWDQIDGTEGSIMVVHGDAVARDLPLGHRVYVNEGSSMLIDGLLNAGAAKIEVRGGSTLEVGIDPLMGDDVTMGDVLEIHDGSTVIIPGDLMNDVPVGHDPALPDVSHGRIYMQHVDTTLTVGGDATIGQNLDIRNDAVMTVGGALIMTNGRDVPNAELGMNWRSVLTTGPGSSLNLTNAWLQDRAAATIDGDMTLADGWFRLRNNGGGSLTVTGTFSKTGTGEFLVQHGSKLDASANVAGTVIEGGLFDVRTEGTIADVGNASVVSSERVYMDGGLFDIGGDLTVATPDQVNAIDLDGGTLNVDGAVEAHRARIAGSGVLQGGTTLTVQDEVYVDTGGSISAGDGAGTLTIDAQAGGRRLRFDNTGGMIKCQIAPGGAAAGAGVGYDTIVLALDTTLAMLNTGSFDVAVSAAGNTTVAPGDVFTILTYDPLSNFSAPLETYELDLITGEPVIDPLTPFDASKIGVVLAADAPPWWDVSGATVTRGTRRRFPARRWWALSVTVTRSPCRGQARRRT